VAGALAGGSLSDRLGRRRVLALSLLLTPVFLILLLFSGATARIPLLLLGGFVGLSTTPVIMAMIQESQPQHRALANGIYMVASLGVRSLVTLILGLLADGIGLRSAFLLSACAAFLALPLILALPRSTQRSLP
jgi:FSR family fosmidomycin resistance protein-like MFS transporter